MKIVQLKRVFWGFHLLVATGIFGAVLLVVREDAGVSNAAMTGISGVSSPLSPVTPRQARPISDYQPIWQKFSPALVPGTGVDGPIRPQRPSLRVTGIVHVGSASKGANSVALVVNSRGESRACSRGEEVEGARILEIGADCVDFDFRGERFRVYSDKGDVTSSRPTVTTGALGATPPDSTESHEVSPGNWVISRGEIDRLMDNSAIELTRMQIKPHFDANRNMDGLHLTQLQTTATLAKRGFKTGDVIKSVNGKAIANVQEALNLYNKIKDEKKFIVEILRDGKTEKIEYEVR
ncbi:MAG: PDZ domain-containing protein [Planctomycetota bacterium]